MSLSEHYLDDMLLTVSVAACILFTPVTLIAALDNESTSVTLEVNPAEFHLVFEALSLTVDTVVQDGVQRVLYSLGAENTLNIPDRPELPVVSRTILVPPQSEIRLQINQIPHRVETGFDPAVVRFRPTDFTGFEASSALAATDLNDLNSRRLTTTGFWPPEPVVLAPTQILRGYHLATIHFFPVQHNLTTGDVRFNESADISIIIESESDNHPEDPGLTKPSIWARRALRGLVENPPSELSRDERRSGSYLYISSNANGVAAALQPLLEWRRRQGHRVQVEYFSNQTSAAVVMRTIREAYESDDPVEFVTLVGDGGGGIRVAPASQTGDHAYTCLEGNDQLPDIAIGRLSCESVHQLRRIVAKLVGYEAEPYMEDRDWFTQGAVVAGYTGNGLSTVLVAKYVRQELLRIGFDEIRHWYHTVDGSIGNDNVNQPFLQDAFEWGVGVFHYRAFSRMNGLPLNVINNLRNRDGQWPPVLCISCNTGNFTNETSPTEAFLRAEGGGIGAVGTATGNTNVKFNNIVAGGVWRGIYLQRLYTFGWGLAYGKYELWRAYHGLDNNYVPFMEWNNLIGDAGTHVWSGVPREIEVTHPETVSPGTSLLTVSVVDPEAETVEPDALVCLYKDDDDIHLTTYTDDNGVASFNIEYDQLSEGSLLITVTKHNVLPYLGSAEVADGDYYLGVSGWELEDDGGGDGIPNPGERLEIVVDIFNFGDDAPEGEITLTLEPTNEWIAVDGDPTVLEEAPEPGESSPATFIASIDPSCPDGMPLLLALEATDGNHIWQSSLVMDNVAPRISIDDFIIENDKLQPGEIQDVDFILANIGGQALPPFTARLESDREVVRIIHNFIEYEALNPNSQDNASDGPFGVRVHPLAIPGMDVELTLSIISEDDFRDTTSITLTIGAPEDGDPFGPDEYGYICYDSEDDDWAEAPVYDWVEIDRDVQGYDFRGTSLDLHDNGDNDDESRTVELPFDFQYYGESFDEITICSNGWAAFGDQDELADFRNRRIGQALGPRAQLCVWWDNLINVNGSDILTYHDDDDGRFIIEWNHMRRLVEGGNGSYETFEIILYDPESHPTPTGDGIITFQYKDVNNQNQAAHNDTPFCTIGISNLDDSGGLEYTYWDSYPPGASTIEDEMAITFRTIGEYETGVVEGTVRDVRSAEPVAGAEIATSLGFWAATDDNGFYRIDDILVGDDYDIVASILGWNDSTRTGFEVGHNETLRIDFDLLHPEFRPSEVGFHSVLRPEDQEEFEFSLTNAGNGPLSWRAVKSARENNYQPWELRESHRIGEPVDDPRLHGVVFTDDHFYVSGKNGDDPNRIYIFNREGELVDGFRQPGDSSNTGMRDLAWDGELIWGSGDRYIHGFTPDGELVTSFEGPYGPNYALAWDPDRELLWCASITRNLIAVDLEGNEQDELNRNSLYIYGLGYWPEDPDGYNLYIFNRPNLRRQVIHKMNPDTGDTLFVRELFPENNGRPSGMFITNQFDINSWVSIHIADASSGDVDRLDIWQIGHNTSWMTLNPMEGVLNPDEDEQLSLLIDASGLPQMRFDGEIIFYHNAMNGRTDIPVILTVQPQAGEQDDRTVALRRGWNQVSLNIEPSNDDLPTIFGELVDGEILNLVKDGQGRFYLPAEDFLNIPGWSGSDGYQVHVNENFDLEVRGTVIDPEEPIILRQNWNLKSYFPREPADPINALESIAEVLVVAKDGRGRFYLPEYDFSNMSDLREGEGYWYSVTEDVDLIYSSGERRLIRIRSTPEPVHFAEVTPTGENMSLLAIGGEQLAGMELAVISTDGTLCGSGRFDDGGRCGLAVWGNYNESVTRGTGSVTFIGHIESSGLTTGERFSLRLWDGSREQEIGFEPLTGSLIWEKNKITVGNVKTSVTPPITFGINRVSPNPFNGNLQLRFGLEGKGLVSLTIYDLTGRQVARLVDEDKLAGNHSVVWRANGWPSGIYLARLEQERRSAVVKVTLVR